MAPSDAPTRTSPKDLAELEDLTNHLSDFVTVFVYHASLFPADLPFGRMCSIICRIGREGAQSSDRQKGLATYFDSSFLYSTDVIDLCPTAWAILILPVGSVLPK
jgi:hypothetical protein